jgi:hypothetical protein
MKAVEQAGARACACVRKCRSPSPPRCGQVNKAIQAFMYTMLADEDNTAAKKSLDVMITLYKKKVRPARHRFALLHGARTRH